MIKCTLTKIFTIFQVMLYHISCHKWELLAYSLLLGEVLTLITSLLSSDMGAYSGLMAILAFAGIATAVKLDLTEQNRNRHS